MRDAAQLPPPLCVTQPAAATAATATALTTCTAARGGTPYSAPPLETHACVSICNACCGIDSMWCSNLVPHWLCVAAPAGWRWRSSSSRPGAAVASRRHDGNTAGRSSYVTHGSSTDTVVSVHAGQHEPWCIDVCPKQVYSLPELRECLPHIPQAHLAVLCMYVNAHRCLLPAAVHSVDASDCAAAAPQVCAPQHVPA
jgi:hypothetical protein